MPVAIDCAETQRTHSERGGEFALTQFDARELYGDRRANAHLPGALTMLVPVQVNTLKLFGRSAAGKSAP